VAGVEDEDAAALAPHGAMPVGRMVAVYGDYAGPAIHGAESLDRAAPGARGSQSPGTPEASIG
jgi:hypothetical protein